MSVKGNGKKASKRKGISKHWAHKIADNRLAIEIPNGGYVIIDVPKGMEVIGDGWVTYKAGKTYADFGVGNDVIKVSEAYDGGPISAWTADNLPPQRATNICGARDEVLFAPTTVH
jgi:hypothetical protein